MSFKKFFLMPLIVTVLAFSIQIVDQLLSPLMNPDPNKGFCWIAFQAWAVYFFAGCDIKGGIKALIGYPIGIAAAILIMELAGGAFSSLGFFSVAIPVGLVACCLMFLDKVPWVNLIPAIFIGAGAFFAFMTYIDGATYVDAAITEFVYCAIGLLFGFFTISLRSLFDKQKS